MNEMLKCWSEQYLVLDFEHAFLADTIAEELILFDVSSKNEAERKIASLFANFKADFKPSQSVHTLSGGERAILVCILYAVVVNIKRVKVSFLLSNIMESLSKSNRTKLLKYMRNIDSENFINLYCLKNGEPYQI